jgi:hypothetical protein
MLRRCLVVSLAAFAALACVAAASAGGSTSTSFPISWVMYAPGTAPPAGTFDSVVQCPLLPSGSWVNGTGTITFLTTPGGNINSSVAGGAVDNAGNKYQWSYRQSVKPIGDSGFSTVVDSFGLSGSGPAAGIHSHFIVTIDGTSIEDATIFIPKQLKGDPFDCDPI